MYWINTMPREAIARKGHETICAGVTETEDEGRIVVSCGDYKQTEEVSK